jgi:hypothetical protein
MNDDFAHAAVGMVSDDCHSLMLCCFKWLDNTVAAIAEKVHFEILLRDGCLFTAIT